jgi:glycosyltransferase involved in cell wall biosynthesis
MTTNASSETQVSKKILIVVPAYNEEGSIGEVIQKVRATYPEVLVYDDGSTDETANIAEKNGAMVIRNSRNRGYGRALNTLFQHALVMNVDIVVTIDSDGQHDPNQIPNLIQPLLDNRADVVIGSRFLTDDDKLNVPKYRQFGIKTITKFAQAGCFDRITDATSGFRAYSTNSLKKLHLTENGMAIATEILLKADQCNLRLLEVPITTTRYDIKDSVTHGPIKLGWSVISHVLKFLSFKHPLLFYGIPGLIFLICSAFIMYISLDLFSSTRYISTNMIIISIGFAILGILLLATSAIVYTIISLFRGQMGSLR